MGFTVLDRKKRKLFLLLPIAACILLAGFAAWPAGSRTVAPDQVPLVSAAQGQTGPASPDGQQILLDPTAGQAIDGRFVGRTHEELLDELKKRQIMVTDTLSSHAAFAVGRAGTDGEWMVENIPANPCSSRPRFFWTTCAWPDPRCSIPASMWRLSGCSGMFRQGHMT
jgi:hypothetical protein